MRTTLITTTLGALLALGGLAANAGAEDVKLPKKELKAKVEAMPEKGLLGLWTIGGHKVEVTPTTKLEEDDGQKFVIGQLVEVEGVFSGEVLHAKSIETEDDPKPAK
jgi:hypothetical protein